MSDRRPKVVVRPGSRLDQYVAWCYEPACQWTFADFGKTYLEERAKVHRAWHRKVADRG